MVPVARLLSSSLVLAVVVAFAPAAASEPGGEEEAAVMDPLHVVRELIRAERWDEAKAVLHKLQQRVMRHAEEHIDPVQMDTLLGLVDLHDKRYDEAVRRFEGVLEARPTKAAVWLYLGQARYALQQFTLALQALDRGRGIGYKVPGYFVLRARTLVALKQAQAAFGTLAEGLGLSPDHPDLLREQALILIDLHLYAAARKKADAYLAASRDKHDVVPYLVLSEALRRAGAFNEAIPLLEEARLRRPGDRRVMAGLAYTYAEAGRHWTAARLFEDLARTDPTYAFEAADQYRLAGRNRDAFRMNGRVLDLKKKLKQRLAIAVAGGRFGIGCDLGSELESSASLSDSLLYELAYSCLHAGATEQAEAWLNRVKGDAFHRMVRIMKDVIASCRRFPARCP